MITQLQSLIYMKVHCYLNTPQHSSSIAAGGRFTVSSGTETVSLTVANTVQGDSGNWTCTVQVFIMNNEPVGDKVQHSVKLLVVGKSYTFEVRLNFYV